MEANFALFLEDELELLVSSYLSKAYENAAIAKSELFFTLPKKFKKAQHPVIIITQQKLAKDLEGIGSLLEPIRNNIKAGVIIVPNKSFVSVTGKELVVTNEKVEKQLQRCINEIMYEQSAQYCLFSINR